MTNPEFSNEFDVLYNSITSNQAPGLDEYEKSVFLTKAQDEIVKSYFNPKSNKVQEGFDGSERRQIDFSMIMRSKVYQPIKVVLKTSTDSPTSRESVVIPPDIPIASFIEHPIKLKRPILDSDNLQIISFDKNTLVVSSVDKYLELVDTEHTRIEAVDTREDGITVEATLSPFTDSFFDMRDSTKAITLEDDILMFINEYVETTRNDNNTRLTVIPVNYVQYSKLMSKPYKRPIKSQAWRLLDNSKEHKKAEIIVGPNDVIQKYVIRYIKRPRAIRLTNFGGEVTLDGSGDVQTCELDEILHHEILQRAVELAKAAYTGDLQSQLTLGQLSQTEIGSVPASK